MAKLIALFLVASIFIATASAACTANTAGCSVCDATPSCTTCLAGYYASAANTCTICPTATYHAATSSATTVLTTCDACTSVTTTGATTCFSANIMYGAILALFALLFWWTKQIKLLEFRAFMFVRVMWRIVLSYFH